MLAIMLQIAAGENFWDFVTSLQWIHQRKQRQIMFKITTITEFDSPIYKKAPPPLLQIGDKQGGAFL